jgi:hypothetical protein
MNVTTMLAERHRRILQLAAAVRYASGNLFIIALVEELIATTALEEHCLYPEAERRLGLDLDGYRQNHAVARSLLVAVATPHLGASLFATRASQLHAVILRHAEKEHRELFPALDRTLTQDEQAVLFARARSFEASMFSDDSVPTFVNARESVSEVRLKPLVKCDGNDVERATSARRHSSHVDRLPRSHVKAKQ